ncbi:MAG: HAD family hydrolase [Anaerolineaceae bacterium]|nr:HAD family hydrolase [Anaerolineaceae bacterium]
MEKEKPVFDFSHVKALLFDVDGTLSDSDDRMVEVVSHKLAFLKRVISEEKLQRFARRFVHFAEGPGNSALELADRLSLDHLIAKYLDWQEIQSNHPAEHFPMIPGIVPMLDELLPEYPFAIVTARNEVTTRNFLGHNKLEAYFPHVISSQTCQRTKPFADPLLHAAEILGVPIENCLMIGDTVTDVRAAKAAGAQSLSVLCGFGQEKDLGRAGTHKILPTTSLLAEFLKRGYED